MKWFLKAMLALFGGCLIRIVFLIAFWTGMFALAVRGCTFVAPNNPSLSSFDPNQRIAATEAAADKYGVKKP